MKSDVIKIINNGSNDKIIEIQKENPLKILWVTKPLYYPKMRKILVNILVKNDRQINNNEILAIYNIPVDALSLFPVGSILYHNHVSFLL